MTASFQYLTTMSQEDAQRGAMPPGGPPTDDDLTGVTVHTGHGESAPLDPIPGYEPMWSSESGLGSPGLVVSVIGCRLGCVGITRPRAGMSIFLSELA